MKNKILIFSFLAGFILLSSCQEFLNLKPETSLSSEKAFENLIGVNAGINGIYSILHSDWVERQWIFAEALAGTIQEFNSINNSNYQDAMRHQTSNDLFNTANYLWSLSYQAIHLCNEMATAMPSIEETDQNVIRGKQKALGEILYLRGMLYFVLNRFWAQAQNGLSVPLLTSVVTVEDSPSRATIEEVEAQVVADLEEAERLLAGVDDNKGRANQWAVKALLARVYFEYEAYDKAKTKADEIINSGKFALIINDHRNTFSETIHSEHIFTFLSTSNDLAALNLHLRYTITNANNIMLQTTDFLWDILSTETSDERFKKLFVKVGGNKNVSRKFDNRRMQIQYIRLPEIFLIRAESLANLDQLDMALSDLNKIRERAKLGPTNYSNKGDLLNKIYRERTVELALEGDLLFNHKRLKREVGGYPFEEAEFKLVFFIPETETSGNPNMIQNDFW